MAESQDLFNPIKEAVSGGSSVTSSAGGSGLVIGISFFVGIAVIATIIAFIWYFTSERKKWNITTRVHYENPAINGVSLGGGVPTQRVRFKNGLVVYLYKSPIQGYSISPELLTWSKPREHDIIVTQDKKLFCLNGITSIDVQRKQLGVDISHPDIEMDRQDLQKHMDEKKHDDPNDKLKIIAKVATYIFLMITIIVLAVMGGNAYIEGKNVELEKQKIDLQISERQAQVMDGVNTFTTILKELMPELQQLKGTKNINFAP